MKKILCIFLILLSFVTLTAQAQDTLTLADRVQLIFERYDFLYPTYAVKDTLPATTQIVHEENGAISIEFQKDSLSRKYRLIFDKKTTKLVVEEYGVEEVLYCACGKSKKNTEVTYIIKSIPVQYAGEYSKTPGVKKFKEEVQKLLSLKDRESLFVQIEVETKSAETGIIKNSSVATVIFQK